MRRSSPYLMALICTATALSLNACGGGNNQPSLPDTPTAIPNAGAAQPDTNEPKPDPETPDKTTDATDTSDTSDSSNQDALVVVVNPDGDVSCSANQTHIQGRALALINAARASSRNCGATNHPAVPPLTWNTQLQSIALAHSDDMARHNFFSHTGSDGSDVAMRADTINYSWQAIGENIAAGQNTADDAVSGWLESPGHCQNIMSEHFTEMAISCVQNDNTDYGEYWTQVLGNQQ